MPYKRNVTRYNNLLYISSDFFHACSLFKIQHHITSSFTTLFFTLHIMSLTLYQSISIHLIKFYVLQGGFKNCLTFLDVQFIYI